MADVRVLTRRTAAQRLDVFYPVWRLLTSVRFALWLIGFLVVAGFLGIVIPQIPVAMRGDAGAVAGWVSFQRGKFGPLTNVMYALGLFDVFGTLWFRGALAMLAVAVAVCCYNRFPPIWRTIRRPQKRVAEGYLRRARHRAEFATPTDAGALERALHGRRYHVERFEDGDAVYLFADRFQWAQLGTFASHLALIIFIVAGLVSILTGYETQLFIAKGDGAPVFPVQHPNQMQVYVDDTIGRFDDRGRPLDFRSFLTIYQGGREVQHCVATVNEPCSYGGYRFSQAAFYDFGAALEVRDTASGRVIYNEVVDLRDQMPAPRLVVRDGDGRTLVDRTLVLSTVLGGTFLTRVIVPEPDRAFVVGVRRDDEHRRWVMVVFQGRDSAAAPSARLTLAPDEEAALSGLRFRFAGLAALPAAVRPDVPLPPIAEGNDAAFRGAPLLQMANAVYGTAEASTGRAIAPATGDGPPALSISGLGAEMATLAPGESVTVGSYRYTFVGRQPFAGIQVKRDQGAAFMWAAVVLLVAGLAITFHVPRRRLWAKITPDRTYVAGLAAPMVDFGHELRRLGAEAGAPYALDGDEDRE